MRKVLTTSVFLLAGLLTVCLITGCGDDYGSECCGTGDLVAPAGGSAPANFLSALPPSGSEIAANANITLTFDKAPAYMAVSTGRKAKHSKVEIQTSGITVTVTLLGRFRRGPLTLTVIWSGGTHTLTYTVTSPD